MDFEGIKFPVYRKYKNNKSYFKIMNPAAFEEIQIIGTKKIVKHIEAKLFPEKLFIHDLVFNYSEMADEVSAAGYQAIKDQN